MKFGVVSYQNKPLALDGRDSQNMGDWIQTIAMLKLIHEIDDTSKAEFVSRYEISTWKSDEYIFIPYNSFNELTDSYHTAGTKFPPASCLIPLYVSFHLHNTIMPEALVQHLRNYQPIGCRDEETLINLRRYNIRAYLSGCVTSLLDKRTIEPKKPKILFIDTPKSLEPYIPEEYCKNMEYISHIFKIPRKTGAKVMMQEEADKIYNYTINLLEYYKNEATLVVTSRLHAASPCMAMGIPVILAGEDFDGRFSWIDRYLKFYTPDKFSQIDWNPAPIDYEEEKNIIKEIIKEHIIRMYGQYNNIYKVSEIWENRKREVYNKKMIERLKSLPFSNQKIQYVIWGATFFASVLYRVILNNFPEWNLIKLIDKNCMGLIEGIEIEKPDVISNLPKNTLYIITAESAFKEICSLLENKEKYHVCISNNYFSFSKNCTELADNQ